MFGKLIEKAHIKQFIISNLKLKDWYFRTRELGSYIFGSSSLMLSSLITIPIIIKYLSLDVWASIVVAQTFGMFFSILIDFGHGLVGASSAKMIKVDKRRETYLSSISLRASLSLLLIPLACLSYLGLYENNSPVFLLIVIASASQSLSSAWIFLAEDNPSNYLKIIIVPRLLSNLLGAVVCIMTKSLLIFAFVQLLCQICSIVLMLRYVSQNHSIKLKNIELFRNGVLNRIRNEVNFLFASSAFSLLNYIPILIIARSTSNQYEVAQFVLLDRIVKYGVGALAPLVQFLQSKSTSDSMIKTKFKLDKVFRSTLAFSFLIFVVSCILLPTLAKILTNGVIVIDLPSVLIFSSLVGFHFVINVLSSIHLVYLNWYRSIASPLMILILVFLAIFNHLVGSVSLLYCALSLTIIYFVITSCFVVLWLIGRFR